MKTCTSLHEWRNVGGLQLAVLSKCYYATLNINQPNSDLLCNGRALNWLSSTFYCYDTSPTLPLSAEVNIALFTPRIHCSCVLHIGQICAKLTPCVPSGHPAINLATNTLPTGGLRKYCRSERHKERLPGDSGP
jgi:hypothetical protein